MEEGADIYVTMDYFGSNAPISLDYLERFRKMEGVTKVFPRIVGRTYFVNRLATIVGILPENIPKSIHLAQGGMFRERGEVVVGKGLAKEFRLQLGVRFSLSVNSSKLFRVAGIFDSNATIWSANLILMSFEDASEFFKMEGKATDILIYTRPGYAPFLAKEIQEKMEASNPDQMEPPLRVQDKTIGEEIFSKRFQL